MMLTRRRETAEKLFAQRRGERREGLARGSAHPILTTGIEGPLLRPSTPPLRLCANYCSFFASSRLRVNQSGPIHV